MVRTEKDACIKYRNLYREGLQGLQVYFLRSNSSFGFIKHYETLILWSKWKEKYVNFCLPSLNLRSVTDSYMSQLVYSNVSTIIELTLCYNIWYQTNSSNHQAYTIPLNKVNCKDFLLCIASTLLLHTICALFLF